MAKLLKLRRGTTTQHGSFTGAEGELTIDTTKDTAVVHDGSQAGGRPLLREDMSNLPAGTIDNADVNASAAIAGTKISPDFGSQDITTTGKLKFANVYTNEADLPSASTYHGMFAHVHSTGLAYYAHSGSWHKLAKLNAPDFTGGIDVTGNVAATGNVTALNITASNDITAKDMVISDTTPTLVFADSDHNPDFKVNVDGGLFKIYDSTNSADRFIIHNGGTVEATGNIQVGGTVDGRDVAADGTKLDGIESGATADQTNAQIAAALSDQRPNMKGATFTDDGTNSPVVKIRTDDNSPWGLQVANDGYWNNDSNGLKIYQNTNGDIDHRITGNNEYVNYDINLQSGSTTQNVINCDTNRAVNLKYQGNQKLATTSSGVSITGDMTASGNVTAYSDARLKNEVTTINDALGIVGKLRGVSYKWLETDTAGIGVIAQEIEEVLPEVVATTRGTLPSTGETTEIKSVDYGKIVGVLINAINELKAEVDALKKPKKKGGK